MSKDEQKGDAQAAGGEGFAGQTGGQGYGQQQFMGQQPLAFPGAQPQYQFQPQGQFMGQPPLGAFAGGAQGMAEQPNPMGQAGQAYGQQQFQYTGQPQFQPQFQPQGQFMGQPQYAGQPQGQYMGGGFTGQQPQGGYMGQAMGQGVATAPDGAERLHDKNQFGQQNGPDMGQMYGMMQDVMKGEADPGKIMSFLQASGGDFWKGAIVGAAVVLLLTNSAVKDALAGVAGSLFGSRNADEASAAAAEEA